MKKLLIIQRVALLATVTLVVTGCETTGDSQHGGFLNWSEKKAQEKDAASQAEYRRENSRFESEETESNRLKRQQNTLNSKIDRANAELSSMLLEVRHIEKSGGTQLADKAASVRERIVETKGSANPDEQQVRALRREVESLREEMRLLQQRQ